METTRTAEHEEVIRQNTVLKRARYWYYVKRDPIMDDDLYDELKRQLALFVEDYPEYNFITLVTRQLASDNEIHYTEEEKRRVTYNGRKEN